MVEYPMMAMYLTKEQCKTIIRPFLNAGLLSPASLARCYELLSGVLFITKASASITSGPHKELNISSYLAILWHATCPMLTGQFLCNWRLAFLLCFNVTYTKTVALLLLAHGS